MTMSRVNLMKSIVTNFIVQTKERHKISIELCPFWMYSNEDELERQLIQRIMTKMQRCNSALRLCFK